MSDDLLDALFGGAGKPEPRTLTHHAKITVPLTFAPFVPEATRDILGHALIKGQLQQAGHMHDFVRLVAQGGCSASELQRTAILILTAIQHAGSEHLSDAFREARKGGSGHAPMDRAYLHAVEEAARTSEIEMAPQAFNKAHATASAVLAGLVTGAVLNAHLKKPAGGDAGDALSKEEIARGATLDKDFEATKGSAVLDTDTDGFGR